MYVRTIVADLVPGKTEQAIRIFRDEIVPVVREQAGYISTSIYIDHKHHQAQTVSFWESKEAAEATSQGSEYLDTVTAHLAQCVVNRQFDQWEVVLTDSK
jgi:heme-degrading monooxygenase HmoA